MKLKTVLKSFTPGALMYVWYFWYYTYKKPIPLGEEYPQWNMFFTLVALITALTWLVMYIFTPSSTASTPPVESVENKATKNFFLELLKRVRNSMSLNKKSNPAKYSYAQDLFPGALSSDSAEGLVAQHNSRFYLLAIILLVVVVVIVLQQAIGGLLKVSQPLGFGIAITLVGGVIVYLFRQTKAVQNTLSTLAIMLVLYVLGSGYLRSKGLDFTTAAMQQPGEVEISEVKNTTLSVYDNGKGMPESSKNELSTINTGAKFEDARKEVEIMASYVDSLTSYILGKTPPNGSVVDWSKDLQMGNNGTTNFYQTEQYVSAWFQNGLPDTSGANTALMTPFKKRVATAVGSKEIDTEEGARLVALGQTLGVIAEYQQQMVLQLQACTEKYKQLGLDVNNVGALEKLEIDRCWALAQAQQAMFNDSVATANINLAALGSTLDMQELPGYVESLAAAAANVGQVTVYTSGDTTTPVKTTATAIPSDIVAPSNASAPAEGPLPSGCSPSASVSSMHYVASVQTLWDLFMQVEGATVVIDEVRSPSCGGAIVKVPTFGTWYIVVDPQYAQPTQGDALQFKKDPANSAEPYQTWLLDTAGQPIRMVTSKVTWP